MQPIQLFDLASRQAEWLSVRQEVVATNIANANTPKFHAKDVSPFEAVMQATSQQVGMAKTHPAHFGASELSENIAVRDNPINNEIGMQESGNSVALAEEMTKTGEIKRQYDLNASLVKSFHRMMLMTVKR
ncbi:MULTISPECIES: flagellar basal body rod protein FlgB [Rhizobium/Agrobacterium group]|jgi:flagellar basal-body rod protein FlgB|uniref:Flagellar basal body rod protein FlgB n=3 Tax=Rhizobium/Agrobacterium group TaxID=227290 RepID=A0A1B9V4W3_AGRTU|nr:MULTISPECIES: flagellar basal body rod protein FlgB [Rhizobium/Agrobacterium group]AHK00414.1 flagellar basal-body rod protein FlgB [Agrobacterium tumefaciens LBA4213 (Ach5)]AKC06260.1 flagellar basal-body rod protein FlgB [Agrobacterium tumefaciens]EHJ98343.1 flagellar basal body rod protein FlgB [Agrobacterium tumefaciens 5A]KJF71541.1 flagellar basal body rod protein FlgB [Agrobacterium arsenijevicii]MDP9559708.1 flagellar basal-body rod protein FlgB [Rhizobium nepotum]QDG92240.1 flagel